MDLWHPDYPLPVASIPERIEQILAEQGITARELARRAELNGSVVSNLLSPLEEDPEAVTLRTLNAIARGAKVSPAWLICGIDPEHQQPTAPPNLRRAADLALEEGVWHAAVRSVLSDEVAPEHASRSVVWWKLRMIMREEELVDEATRRVRRRTEHLAAARTKPEGPPAEPSPQATTPVPSSSGEQQVTRRTKRV